jgi:hypothetical protein
MDRNDQDDYKKELQDYLMDGKCPVCGGGLKVAEVETVFDGEEDEETLLYCTKCDWSY